MERCKDFKVEKMKNITRLDKGEEIIVGCYIVELLYC